MALIYEDVEKFKTWEANLPTLTIEQKVDRFVIEWKKSRRSFFRYKRLAQGKSNNYLKRKLDKNNCYFCNSDFKVQIHHINKNKTDNRISNLMCLCTSCHVKLHVIYNKWVMSL
jgi:5-methylcytosine-specific restriction endonuclease McrA